MHQELDATLVSAWARQTPEALSLLVQSALPASAHESYGAPGAIWTQIDLPADPGAARIDLSVNFFNQTRTRIPEAIFVRFNVSAAYRASPGAAAPAWFASKLGERVWPFDVQAGGNRHLHGNDGSIGATIADPAGAGPNATLTVWSRHAGAACFGHPTGFPAPLLTQPDPAEGAAFMLANTVW